MNRPRASTLCLAALLLPAMFGLEARGADDAKPGAVIVYVGTYSGPKSKGIYMMRFDPATGALSAPEVAAESKNPSFLTIAPDNKHVYAIGETNEFNGTKGVGAVSAFSIDPASGKLTLINQQSAGGAGPCYVSTDKTGKVALVANYGSGSVESLPIKEDGSLGEPATFVQHADDAGGKRKPHGHSINVTPDNKYAIAADLGLDKLLIYKLDTATGKMTPGEPAFAATPPKGGPRHLAWHPNGKFAFVCNEQGMAVTTFAYDADKGTLAEVGTVSTLPAGTDLKGMSTAEVQVHPNGKFCYVSNRGHDTIAIFTIDEASGKLTPAGHASSGGKTPRNFRIDPTGQYLFAANQDSNNIAVMKIDQQTGALTATGTNVELSAPVCVKFYAAK